MASCAKVLCRAIGIDTPEINLNLLLIMEELEEVSKKYRTILDEITKEKILIHIDTGKSVLDDNAYRYVLEELK